MKNIISFDFVKKIHKGFYKKPYSQIEKFEQVESVINEELKDLINSDWSVIKQFYALLTDRGAPAGRIIILRNVKTWEIKQFSLAHLVKNEFDLDK